MVKKSKEAEPSTILFWRKAEKKYAYILEYKDMISEKRIQEVSKNWNKTETDRHERFKVLYLEIKKDPLL